MTEVDGQNPNSSSNEHTVSESALAGVVDSIRSLANNQPFGMLCTQFDGQPYGSMIALAFTPDMKNAVFSTPRATRKYHNLTECHRVAIVVNDLDKHPDELMKVSAFTLTGQASEVTEEEDRTRWSDILLERHPELKSFVESPSTALFRVRITRFFHVSSFQEVTQWSPSQDDN
jgi:nitroimidazol reductase NimA-like FMN-containing flavoprotein (pyridoxamine 5'-phosphate oxidase superfamily)